MDSSDSDAKFIPRSASAGRRTLLSLSHIVVDEDENENDHYDEEDGDQSSCELEKRLGGQ